MDFREIKYYIDVLAVNVESKDHKTTQTFKVTTRY